MDGEGCFVARANVKRRQRHLPRLAVGNTNENAIRTLHEWFGGGTVYTRSLQEGGRRTVYAWEVTGARAVYRVTAMLAPHLRCKRAEAELMLALCGRIIAWRQGIRLTDEELMARNALADALVAAKRA